MAFQLKIAEGKDAGKEFVFEQDSVLIGRTPECDVVLYDAGCLATPLPHLQRGQTTTSSRTWAAPTAPR